MLAELGLFHLLDRTALYLANQYNVGEGPIVAPNPVRLLFGEVEISMTQGFHPLLSHKVIGYGTYRLQAAVVHLPQHQILQVVVCGHCIAGALHDRT